MTSVRLFLLGTPRIERDGVTVELGLRRAMALVAYLAVTGRPQSRDLLAGLLWPESDQTTARSNLRRTVYRIQRSIEPTFLLVSQETLAISAEVGFWLDVTAYERQVAQSLPDGSPLDALSQESRTQLESALTLYADDFMTGFFLPDSEAFEEWQFFERERLRQVLARVLVQLAHTHLAEGNPTNAIPLARRWLGLDPLHEPAHRLLMEFYSRSGQQAAALRQYRECSRQLEESLGVAPEAETIQLYEAIRKGKEDWHIQRASEPAEVGYVQSGEVHIAYQVLGSGSVDLLVIHGFISHLEQMWEGPGVAQALRRLAGFSRLILFDKRGVGLSDRVGYPPTLEHTADDARAVMDAVGSKHAVLFGYSEGGPASLMFCATYPERVSGLILYGTTAKGSRAPDYPWALPESLWNKWLSALQQVYGKPIPYIYFAPSHADDSELWEWFARVLRLGSSPGEIQGVFEVLRDMDVRKVLPVIRVPTLVLHRVEDQLFRVESGRYLAKNIPGARYVELPGDDHWWWMGNSDAVINEMETFIAKLKPPTSVDRSLATILCLGILRKEDISSGLVTWLEDSIRREVKRFHGQQAKGGKHLYLAAFDGPSRAIQCGVTLRLLASQRRIPIRVTLHTGECLLADEDLRGSAVEIAVAMEDVANEGEVLVSRTVKDLVVGAGFSFEGRGTHLFSEKLGTWELFEVV